MERIAASLDAFEVDHYLRKLLIHRLKLMFRHFNIRLLLKGANIDTILRALIICLMSAESPASRTLGLRVKHQSTKKVIAYFILVVILPASRRLLDNWYKRKLTAQFNQDTTCIEATASDRQLRVTKRVLDGIKLALPAMQLFALLRWWSGKGGAPTPSMCFAGISYEEREQFVNLNVSYAHRRWTYEEFLRTFLMLSPFTSFQDTISFSKFLTSPFRQLHDYVRSRKKDSCTLCQDEPIVVPYAADCGHLYCYSCLWNAINCRDRFSCPRCGHKIISPKRV
mmetsp:Transcript_3185/g.4721  ORF Transcript_3185/g.4721 Transcript_3185/m.4721 type:complete len:282 (-) Transcript_3185:3791-4636(-)